jgi:hypothetical protein
MFSDMDEQCTVLFSVVSTTSPSPAAEFPETVIFRDRVQIRELEWFDRRCSQC